MDRFAREDPFLSDALQGYRQQPEGDHDKQSEKLKTHFLEEKKKRELDPAIEIVEKAIAARDASEPHTSSASGPSELRMDRLKTLHTLMLLVDGFFESFIDGASRETLPLQDLEEQKS